jgi:hypothetical protein
LPPAIPGGEVRTVFKSMTRSTLEIIGYGSLQVGQDFDHLTSATLPLDPDDPLYQVRDLLEVRPENNWIKDELGVVRQTGPYPMTILAVTRELEFTAP